MKKTITGLGRITALFNNPKRSIPLVAGVLGAALLLLLVRLLSHVPYAAYEQAQRLGSANLSAIKEDALYAPIKALQLGILKYTENDAYIRLASVAVAVVAAWLLYAMVRKWHTRRVSLLTSAMFISSTLYLQLGRSANLEVLYLTVLPLLLLICMWLLNKQNNKKLPLAGLLLGFALYIPGTWLFVVLGAIFLRKIIIRTIKTMSWKIRLASAGTILVVIAPLIYSLASNPTNIVTWLGFNKDQELTISAIGQHVLDIPNQLFFNGIDNPATWLHGTPIFEIVSVAMIIMGLYAYRAGFYPAREKLVFGSIIVSVLLIGLGNVATIALLVPVLYIVIANGLAYMLQSWFAVFPKNPVARPLGIALLTIVVIASCSYQLQRYFVAWPQADATQKALTSER